MNISKRHLLNYSILVPYLILSVIGLIVIYSIPCPIRVKPFSVSS